MVEELTRDVIFAIANITQQMPTKSIGIPSFESTVIGAIIGAFALIGVSMYKSYVEQRRHDESKKHDQKMKLIDQLSYHDNEIVQIANNLCNTDQKFLSCVTYARQYLIILDRISYLKLQGLIDDVFLEYFHPDFNIGKTLLKWLEITHHDKHYWDYAALNFRMVKGEIEYSEIRLRSQFYYYARKCNDDSSYNPKTDEFESRLYDATKEDREILKPDTQDIK